MEKEINIAEILKDMPKGTKLYSPICGECELMEVAGDKYPNPILVKHWYGNQPITIAFTTQGYLYDLPNAECLLFPSKSMKDWSKFTWKKGDVLVSDSGRKEVIFDHYTDDYFKFVGRHLLITDEEGCRYSTDKITLVTEMYSTEEKDAAQCYVNTLQEMLNGRLNKDTLEIEKKEKPIFKPFDKVLVRNYDNSLWGCSLFSHKTSGGYSCIDLIYHQCIPYEGNEHLVGTTLSPKEK